MANVFGSKKREIFDRTTKTKKNVENNVYISNTIDRSQPHLLAAQMANLLRTTMWHLKYLLIEYVCLSIVLQLVPENPLIFDIIFYFGREFSNSFGLDTLSLHRKQTHGYFYSTGRRMKEWLIE